MTPLQAVAVLKSQPVVMLDDEACRNAEDDEPNAMVILDVAQRDAIVSLLVGLIKPVE